MAISSVHSSRESPSNSSSSKLKKMKALAANKKVVKRRSPPPKKSKGLVEAKGEVVKREYGCVDENSLAMRRAQELQANLSPEFPSLVKFMLHSHTTGGFWLGLPKEFCTSQLPNHDAAIVLVDENGKEMETKYLVGKRGLSAGWRGFSLAHNLIAGDVLVFQLIEPFKIKVYIVRANDSTDVAGAISLLNLSHSAQPIATEGLPQQGDDIEENVLRIRNAADQITRIQHQGDIPQREVSTSDHCPASNLSGNDSDNSPQTSNGLRFAKCVVDFAQVKDFESFNIVVNNIIIDSEIPEGHRLKYYELCCSRKAYLHERLLDGLNYMLIAGAITETVNIADAIRAAKLTTPRDLLEVWDTSLKGIEHFGIQVGFLRDRISKLISLSCESADIVASKREEKAKAEVEMKDLQNKIAKVREVIKNLDTEIQAYSSKERLEELFKDVANAAW